MKLKNISIIIFILVAGSTIFFSFNSPPAKDAEGFKNLKVLPKDISKKQLDSTMYYYCVSLGAHCNLCHARKDSTSQHLDFASDAKPEKGRAREMVLMTAEANEHYFSQGNTGVGENKPGVTCFTCHRGASQPTVNNLMPQYDAQKAAMEAAQKD